MKYLALQLRIGYHLTGDEADSGWLNLFGLYGILSSFAKAISANAPDPPFTTPACPYTSSPCFNSEGATPSPTCLITPEKSIPRVDGNGSDINCWKPPSRIFQSAGFTPAAFIVIRTFPEDTVGSDVLCLISIAYNNYNP
jgi:hypothetical protein